MEGATAAKPKEVKKKKEETKGAKEEKVAKEELKLSKSNKEILDFEITAKKYLYLAMFSSVKVILQNIGMMMKTAAKNRALAQEIIDAALTPLFLFCSNARSWRDPTASTLYKVWFKVSTMRDLARTVFHGGALSDLLSGGI